MGPSWASCVSAGLQEKKKKRKSLSVLLAGRAKVVQQNRWWYISCSSVHTSLFLGSWAPEGNVSRTHHALQCCCVQSWRWAPQPGKEQETCLGAAPPTGSSLGPPGRRESSGRRPIGVPVWSPLLLPWQGRRLHPSPHSQAATSMWHITFKEPGQQVKGLTHRLSTFFSKLLTYHKWMSAAHFQFL